MNQKSGIISAPPLDEGLVTGLDTDLASTFDAGTEELDDAAPDAEVRSLEVRTAWHGLRVDRMLAEAATEFSRSYLQQLLAGGGVHLNGALVTKASQKVRAGDQVTVELKPTQQSQAFLPQPMALDVVFEDAYLMVINKPAGLVVHPAPGNWSGTLLNGLLARAPAFSTVPRAGIVHRLDKDTSGLMVVAKTRETMDALITAIAARAVSRQYLALAAGHWSGEPQRSVDAAIGRDPRNRLRMAVVDLQHQSGKPARTDVLLLDQGNSGFLARCILHTGRTHQIRVHMASLGYPLVGDTTYGGKAAAGMVRQALHAERLGFLHPNDGRNLEFVAPAPTDFMGAMALWGLRYNSPRN